MSSLLPSALQRSRTDHVPVLADEVRELLAVRPGQTVVDATFGAGGHSRLLVDVFMNPQLGGPDWGGLSLEVYGLVERVDHAAGDGFGVAVSFTSSVFR